MSGVRASLPAPYKMIIQQIHSTTDMANHQSRTTVYKTLEDPATGKKYLDISQYFFHPYTNTGQVEQQVSKGASVDLNA